MTIEQVKAEAKKRFNKDITDEQAQAWLEAHPAGELQDEELENVAGGGCGKEEVREIDVCDNGSYGPCPRCGHNKNIQQWYVSSGREIYIVTEYIKCEKCGLECDKYYGWPGTW